MKPHILALNNLSACSDAVAFADTHETLESAWQACERGDWLLWLLGKKACQPDSESRKKLVACCLEVAREALPIFEKRYPDDKRARECLDVAEKYLKGEATLQEVRNAAAYAADAAYAAADAADAARKASLKKSAEIVRKHYLHAPEL